MLKLALILALLVPQLHASNILLFVGLGTNSSDVAAVKTVLSANGFTYTTANTPQMNAMTAAGLKAYKLLLVPGGNSIIIGKYLTKATTAKIRSAVQNDGVHYLGICAGAFFAGNGSYNNANLTSGVVFDFYEAHYDGLRVTSENLLMPDGSYTDLYWNDGPQLTGWGKIVARYPDNTPAVAEGYSGKGWMIIIGLHAEAQAGWESGMKFTTSVKDQNAYAATLIGAALNGISLPHF